MATYHVGIREYPESKDVEALVTIERASHSEAVEDAKVILSEAKRQYWRAYINGRRIVFR